MPLFKLLGIQKLVRRSPWAYGAYILVSGGSEQVNKSMTKIISDCGIVSEGNRVKLACRSREEGGKGRGVSLR